jgi:hypothetical protein
MDAQEFDFIGPQNGMGLGYWFSYRRINRAELLINSRTMVTQKRITQRQPCNARMKGL